MSELLTVADSAMDIVFLTRTNRPVAVRVLKEILKEKKLNVKGVVAEETLRGKSIRYLRKRFIRQVRSHGFWSVTAQTILLLWNKIAHLVGIKGSDECFTLGDLRHIYDLNLHVVQNMHDEKTVNIIRDMEPDIGVVVGTGILKPKVFRIPKQGTINMHQGKVPEYRGGPPAFWELFNDEKTIGVTIHFIDEKLDTGDVILQKEIEIMPDDSLESLQHKLDGLGKKMVVEALLNIRDGTSKSIPQGKRLLKINRLPTKKQRAMLKKKLKERKRQSEKPTTLVDQSTEPTGP